MHLFSAGQEQVCLSDTVSTTGLYIGLLLLQTEDSAVSVQHKLTGKVYYASNLCKYVGSTVDTLNHYITNAEIATLLNCSQPALKAVGFILFARRQNRKDSVLCELNKLINSEYGLLTYNCTDVVRRASVARFCFNLLIAPNSFLKPKFKLTKLEKALLEKDLAYVDLPYN